LESKITVEAAIKRGRLIILSSTMFCLIGIIITTFLLATNKIIPFWIFIASFIYAPVLASVMHNMIVRKWALWAFKNVEDLYELKRRAFEETFIYANEKRFNNVKRYYSKKNQLEWNLILERFKVGPVFIDDYTIVEEAQIYYTRDVENVQNPTAQIILNDKGIYTIFTGFYKWSEIKSEQLITKIGRSSKSHHFFYEHPKGSRILNIDRFDIDPYRFTRLLKIYRGRNEVKNNNP
jgi:hypothetical protein